MYIYFSLAIRNEKKHAFEMAYNKFEKEWTNGMRKKLKEFDEIRNLRIQYMNEKKDYTFNQTNEDSDADHYSVCKPIDPADNLVPNFKKELEVISYRLNIINIYMNRSITTMINKYETFLQDELKIFLESITPIVFKMLEHKNDNFHVLAENVKYDVNNPHKTIPKQFMDHFGDR